MFCVEEPVRETSQTLKSKQFIQLRSSSERKSLTAGFHFLYRKLRTSLDILFSQIVFHFAGVTLKVIRLKSKHMSVSDRVYCLTVKTRR